MSAFAARAAGDYKNFQGTVGGCTLVSCFFEEKICYACTGDTMTVYLDEVLLLNGLVDYLLLAVSGNLLGIPLKRRRILFAGVLGGIYAMLSLLPDFMFLQTLFWKILMAVALCLVSFGPSGQLIRQTIVLFLLTAAFSGVVLLLTEIFSTPGTLIGGTVYYPLSFGALILTAGGACGIMSWGLGRLMRRGGGVVPLELVINGIRVPMTAMRDTGNTLRDPISGWPVLVADWKVFRQCCPELSLTEQDFAAPQTLMERILYIKPNLRPRLIPYKTVGVSHGMLLALRPEEVIIDGKRENMLIAFSPVTVSDGGGYRALLGGTS